MSKILEVGWTNLTKAILTSTIYADNRRQKMTTQTIEGSTPVPIKMNNQLLDCTHWKDVFTSTSNYFHLWQGKCRPK